LSAHYYAQSQRHLAIVRTLLAMLSVDDQRKALAFEYTSLSDIYHGLGATRTALTVGVGAGGLVYLMSGDWSGFVLLSALAIGGAGAAVLYQRVHANRSEVLGRLVATAHHGLDFILDAQARRHAEKTASPDGGEQVARPVHGSARSTGAVRSHGEERRRSARRAQRS
jgi:hypothetical protein